MYFVPIFRTILVDIAPLALVEQTPLKCFGEEHQERLSEKSSLHPTYIGTVGRGERNIALKNILNLAKALGCSPKDLMPD
jgi:hypothetical protein